MSDVGSTAEEPTVRMTRRWEGDGFEPSVPAATGEPLSEKNERYGGYEGRSRNGSL
jgi:hypothetical protein